MILRLILIRHSLTYLNTNNLYSGQLDVPIIENIYPNVIPTFDLCLSSTMVRCKQTVSLLNQDNKDVIYDDRLIEAGYGEITGNLRNHIKFKRSFFNHPPYSPFYKSESIYESGIRAYNCLEDHKNLFLLNGINDLLIVSHKNTLRGLWYQLNMKEFTIEDFDNFPKFKNCIPVYRTIKL